jgi:hypothetical protein
MHMAQDTVQWLSYEYGNELSVAIVGGVFLERLSNDWFLKDTAA